MAALKKMKLSYDLTTNNGIDAYDKISKFWLINKQGKNKLFCLKCKFYKLILMDIDIGSKSESEATSEISNFWKNTNFTVSIVGLSVLDEEEIKEKNLNAGRIQNFIKKPITVHQIKNVVSKYVFN